MKTKNLVRTAMIAAVYVTMCLVLAPVSYGSLQIRASEALTLLPVLCPEAIIGVTLGCFIANMIGSVPLDMVVGSLATLLAALATYKLRNIRWKGLAIASSIPPIVINAVVIGVMSTFLWTDKPFTLPLLLFNMATVGIGQVISCGILGVGLVRVIESTPPLLKLFGAQTKEKKM